MEIIKKELKDINLNLPLKSSLIVVGYFDGLHHYHQKLLSTAQKIAASENLKFILVIFDKKIADHLKKKKNDLISNKTKIALLKKDYQIDYLIELKVNQTLINLSPQKFLNFLEQKLGAKKMVEGQDFCFGAQCTGKIDDLIETLGSEEVVVFKRQKGVSATKIRQWLALGKIRKINRWLHRHLELTLKVNQGEDGTVNYELIYPQAKLKNGLYEVYDQEQRSLILKINQSQIVEILQDEHNLLAKKGNYQLQFKKYLGAKK